MRGRHRNDLTGFRSNKLTVVEFFDRIHNKNYWLCQCDCGEVCIVRSDLIQRKANKSCGHERLEMAISGTTAFNHLLSSYRRSAREDGRSWRLSRKQFAKLIFDSCHYCGCPPSRKHQTRLDRADMIFVNGIDRTDNKLGYSKENCVTSCTRCNFAKHASSLEDFNIWLEGLAKNQLRKVVECQVTSQ